MRKQTILRGFCYAELLFLIVKRVLLKWKFKKQRKNAYL